MVRAGTAAAPLRCRFRLAQSSGCAWCVYRRNHRPRLLVSATPNPTCDRFAGHGGTDRGPTLPCNRLSCFLSGWARIVAALKANPKPAQVARAIGGVHHTTVWQIARAKRARPIGKSRSASASFASLARDSGTPGRENRSLAILKYIQCKKTANITGRNSGARIDFAGSDRRTIEKQITETEPRKTTIISEGVRPSPWNWPSG